MILVQGHMWYRSGVESEREGGRLCDGWEMEMAQSRTKIPFATTDELSVEDRVYPRLWE